MWIMEISIVLMVYTIVLVCFLAVKYLVFVNDKGTNSIDKVKKLLIALGVIYFLPIIMLSFCLVYNSSLTVFPVIIN